MTQSSPVEARPLLLLVDQDAAVADALRFQLETEGYEVETFRDAAALLAASIPDRPSCLVVDFDLPDMDGPTLLRRLRGRGLALPAVLVSSQLAARDAACATPIIHKPLMADELVTAVAGAMLAASGGAGA